MPNEYVTEPYYLDEYDGSLHESGEPDDEPSNEEICQILNDQHRTIASLRAENERLKRERDEAENENDIRKGHTAVYQWLRSLLDDPEWWSSQSMISGDAVTIGGIRASLVDDIPGVIQRAKAPDPAAFMEAHRALVEKAKAVNEFDFAFGIEHNQIGDDELTALAELGEALALCDAAEGD
jgi:hypothetical protein